MFVQSHLRVTVDQEGVRALGEVAGPVRGNGVFATFGVCEAVGMARDR